RAFFTQRAPAGITLDSLAILGPTFLLKSTFTAAEIARRFVAELWFYPDGSRILELSTTCLPEEAFQVSLEARKYLRARQIQVGTGVEQTKTRAALDYYIKQIELGGTNLAPRKRSTTRRTATRRTAPKPSTSTTTAG